MSQLQQSTGTSTNLAMTTTTQNLVEYDTWQWEEWHHPDDCDQRYKKRERFCDGRQKCIGSNFEIDTDFLGQDFKGNIEKL